MSATDPIHAVSSIHAYARLTEIERLREHHDDLFRERGRVTAEQLRHVRHHAENLLHDIDRLIADIEDVQAEDVRLRHDSEAIAAMVAVVLRRHGEATARMAVAAIQDQPAASVDGEAATRRETKPAEPATASPADGVPAVEVPAAVPPPAVVQEPVQAAVQTPSPASTAAVPPSTAAREAALAEMDAVERTDVAPFQSRPGTRRTTDMTTAEELATAMPRPTTRPCERPTPPYRRKTQTVLVDPPRRASIRQRLTHDDLVAQQAIRDRIRSDERSQSSVQRPPTPERFPALDAPLWADPSRPYLYPRSGFSGADLDAYVAKHGLVLGPDVIRLAAKLGAASWNLVADQAAAAGITLPIWCENKLTAWRAAGCLSPRHLLVPMDNWHSHDIGLLIPVDVHVAIVAMARSASLYAGDVIRALLVDGLVAPGGEADAGLLLNRAPLVRRNPTASTRTGYTTYLRPPPKAS